MANEGPAEEREMLVSHLKQNFALLGRRVPNTPQHRAAQISSRRRPKYTESRPKHTRSAIAACILLCVTLNQAAGQQQADDPTVACGRAARRAELDWQLPTGLLSAIGIVESSRRASTGTFPIIWPWTIDAEGHGFYEPSKAAAVDRVRTLKLRGIRLIDVGCFQIDLFYHPYGFAGLEEAFDPDSNARAAARILSLGRLNSTGWDGAIAAYHSAVPLIGAVYLQRVRTVWSYVGVHPFWDEQEPPEAYAVLLSPQARLVRIVTPADPISRQPMGLPRIIPVELSDQLGGRGMVVQSLQPP
jgi:hypothetical protein